MTTSRVHLLFAMALGLIGLGTAGCGKEPEPLSALLITLDTTRADALSCLGGRPGVTPNLDRLAAQGTIYVAARTTAPLTLPAHASMLTGLYPPRHSVRDNSLSALPGEAATLAELARAEGIGSAAFVAAVVLRDTFGLAQGFEHYDQPTQGPGQRDSHFDERSAREVTDAALAWWRGRDPSRRSFLWVHYFDAHSPYRPEERFLQQAGGHPYLGEVAQVDHEIGRLLEGLGEEALARTVVMVVGDHGEGLGQHGESTHGTFCYDSTLRVPFLLRDPRAPGAGRRSSEVVSVVDVLPTLADAMGLAIPAGLDGRSLWTDPVPADRGVYFESYYGFLNHGYSPIAGWATATEKHLHSGRPERYRLTDDPGEQRDLPLSDDSEQAWMALAEVAARESLDVRSTADESVLEDLRALGYVAAGAAPTQMPGPVDDTGLPSPADRREEMQEFLRAMGLADGGRPEEAIPILQGLVDGNPRNAGALNYLAAYLIQTGRHAAAIPVLERVLDLGAARATTHLNLGFCLEKEERLGEARQHYLDCLALDPDSIGAARNLVRVLGRLGLEEEAAQVRQRFAPEEDG